MTLYKFIVYVHIIGAIGWVGGILFLGLVAAPAARKLDDENRVNIINEIGNRFRTIGYTLLGILAVTGIVQSAFHGATVANVLNGHFFQTSFGRTLGMKLMFIVLMVGVSVAHDFFVGPAAVRLGQAGHDTARLRKIASWLARITALLALIVVAYASLLVR